MINGAGLISSQDISRKQLLQFLKNLNQPFQPSIKIKNQRNPVGLLAFFEVSTRTRVSFEAAGLELGIKWIHLDSASLSLQKGESYRDTFKTLAEYRPDFIITRHSQSGFPFFLQDWAKVPVINAGDGLRDHPTQGLLDAAVVASLSKKPLKIGFFGDLARSRVLRSDIYFLRMLGHNLHAVSDKSIESEMMLKAYQLKNLSRENLKSMDLIICSRVQTERGSEALQKPLDISDIGAKTWIMHSGPVIAGQDMTLDLFRNLDSVFAPKGISKRNLILKQVATGLEVRKRLLYELCQKKGLFS